MSKALWLTVMSVAIDALATTVLWFVVGHSGGFGGWVTVFAVLLTISTVHDAGQIY